jgi:UDP-glucuronate 4-epimerase
LPHPIQQRLPFFTKTEVLNIFLLTIIADNEYWKVEEKMKILITGGAGFIGSHLCEHLLSATHQVYCLDNFCDFYSPTIKEKNLKSIRNHPDFNLIRTDIIDYTALNKVFLKYEFDMVIHLAAMAGVRPSIENPQLYYHVNINGTLNLLELCKRYNIKKIIFASSSSVYGNNEKVPFSEDDNVDFPISPYAASKKAGELLCHTYHKLYDMSIVCLRFFTVYGPRQRPDLAIHKFTDLIYSHQEIPVYGTGDTMRDYTYIDDIIEGITKSMDYVLLNKKYQIFNLGESRTISLNYMIETLEKTLNKQARRKYLPTQPGDVDKTYADISKSKKYLGYNPQTDFEAGIMKFINWKQQK